jgi:hypothetical protein
LIVVSPDQATSTAYIDARADVLVYPPTERNFPAGHQAARLKTGGIA